MFRKLQTRIIIITMAITTVVLLIAGGSVMFFSSTIRPEPVPFGNNTPMPFNVPDKYTDQELKDFIKDDRKNGDNRLIITLFGVGAIVELIVFLISYFASKKIVEPVKDAYDKQKMFIANASHELKTPLAVIEANMEALDVDKENEEWKNNIEVEITHANKLVLNLLQLAKMDAGSIAKTPSEPVDFGVLIPERVEIFKPKFVGDKFTFSKKTKNTKYVLPKQDMIQVLDILLDNATKYADKKISVTLNDNEIVVANDGATVEKEDLEKIFDRFYQTDKTKEGSGLGLAIAKAISEQNGWKINCESSKNLTRFSVSFK